MNLDPSVKLVSQVSKVIHLLGMIYRKNKKIHLKVKLVNLGRLAKPGNPDLRVIP